MDEHCRITVVGERRQVDLAVPAGAPIASYIDTVARMCRQDETDIMPAAWSLATATTEPFAPEWSLAELGIVDGQILYLRDVIVNEFAEPVVRDVGERVTQVAEGALDRRWDAGARTVGVMLLGLGWLVATLVVLAVRGQVGPDALAGVAVAAGLLLPALAWTASERRWPVPPGLRMALALCAVPVLALAARTLATMDGAGPAHGPDPAMTSAGLTAFALAAGALVGAFLAYVAAPGASTSAVLLAALVAAVTAALLGVVKADGVESAAVVAVVGFGLLTVAPMTVSRLVAFAYRRADPRTPVQEADDAVAAAVRSATTVLLVWSGGLAAVIATALVILADSGSSYAAALACCLGLALLLRAGSARMAAEVVPVGLAGVIGLFALLLLGSGRFGWPYWAGPLYAGLIAVVLLVYGFRRLMRRADLPPMGRPGWLTGLGSLLGGVGIALAAATFGMVDRFLELGRHM
ncbi:EsaB/YukD family protein [Streptomyces polygonati]|uniref:EsaB/YukD family protein n=1 Tax=Streptomyces polygonati TaxID=1617087 RepID=A0ABV8HPM1_9ACTN